MAGIGSATLEQFASQVRNVGHTINDIAHGGIKQDALATQRTVDDLFVPASTIDYSVTQNSLPERVHHLLTVDSLTQGPAVPKTLGQAVDDIYAGVAKQDFRSLRDAAGAAERLGYRLELAASELKPYEYQGCGA